MWAGSISALCILFLVPSAAQAATDLDPLDAPIDPEVRVFLDELDDLRAENRLSDVIDRLESEMRRLEESYGVMSLEIAAALDALVDAYRLAKRMRVEHRDLAVRAVTIKETQLGPDHPAVARSLVNAGLACRFTDGFEEAGPYYARALRILEATLGPDHLELATVLSYESIRLRYLEDLEGAREARARALTITETQLAPDDPRVASQLRGLANISMTAGDFEEARDLLEQAIEILSAAYGPEHRRTASAFNNLGLALRALGNLREALEVQERALTIREAAYGPDHAYVAQSLHNVANLLVDVGDYADARPLLKRALTIRRNTLGPTHTVTGSTLYLLGHTSVELGDLEEATVLLEEAFTIRERAFGPSHSQTAVILETLGHVSLRGQDLDTALSLYRRSLEIMQSVEGPDHPRTLRVEFALALCLRAAAELDESGVRFEHVIEMTEKAFGPGHPRLARALTNHGMVLEAQGDLDAALSVTLEAEAILRAHIRGTARGLSERQALEHAADHRVSLEQALSLATDIGVASGAHASEVWDRVIRSRVMVLDEIGQRRQASRLTGDPAIDDLVRRLRSAREQLATLTVRGSPDQEVDRYQAALTAVRREKEALERELSDRTEGLRSADAEWVGLADVIDALPPRSALLAYATFARRPTSWTGWATERDSLSRFYVAFVYRAGEAEPRMELIGSAEHVDEGVANWRDAVQAPSGNEPANGAASAARGVSRRSRISGSQEETYREAGTALRRLVWDPVAVNLDDVDRVHLVPAGALSLVNFATLPTADTTFLIESGPLLHSLSAERRIAWMAPLTEGDGLLALGGPDFDHPPPGPPDRRTFQTSRPAAANLLVDGGGSPPDLCLDLQELRFSPLPQAAAEAHDVTVLWQDGVEPDVDMAWRPTTMDLSAESVVLLTDSAAGETALKELAPGRRALHLATHGFFLPDRCSGTEHATTSPVTSTSLWNPLLLSGLAMAGANQRALLNSDESDGILTAEEVVTLDLSSVEWVVLSACDTGLGEPRTGEGVFGLRRAFEIAGVRALIMSLWPADDAMTRLFMTRLYEARFRQGHDAAAAVRAASIQLLEQQRARGHPIHPYYWGTFVAVGG